MDPEACLKRAEEALEAGDLAECRSALRDLDRWFVREGFGPPSVVLRSLAVMRRKKALMRRQRAARRAVAACEPTGPA